MDEGFVHSFTCGYGTGIFFIVQSSDIRVSVVSARTNNRLISTPYRTELGECADQKMQHYFLHDDVIQEIIGKLKNIETHLP